MNIGYRIVPPTGFFSSSNMKTLIIVIAVFVVYLQARGIQKRHVYVPSNTSIAQQFLFLSSLKAGGNGSHCANTTELVTPKICKALAAIEDQFELLSCRVFRNQAGYHVCLGVVEGARDYCRVLGPSLRRGPDAERLMCRAIHKHLGNAENK